MWHAFFDISVRCVFNTPTARSLSDSVCALDRYVYSEHVDSLPRALAQWAPSKS